MIKSKVLILILFVLTLFVGVACSSKESPAESSVVISFATGEPFTRAGNGDPADGGGIFFDDGKPDLFIAIVNFQGNVVATYPDTQGKTEVLTQSETQVSVRFKQIINSGNYTVYAVANTKGGVWGAPAAWNFTTGAALDALTFEALTGSDTPAVVDRMPLSAKGTLSVNERLNGWVELELLRCVAKIGFRFKNETEEELTLKECTVTIEEINPTQGYLFSRATDAMGVVRDLNLISGTDLTIGCGVTTNLYGNQLVFPSIAPSRTIGSRYYCKVSFKIGDVSKSFPSLPIHDERSQDILALNRNQYLQIETRINKGQDISFNFEVVDCNQKTEEVFFH